MQSDYYGISIASTPLSVGWRWQVTLPVGSTITSDENFDTAEQAIDHATHWVSSEAAFSALNACLADLCKRRMLSQQEYCNLMRSCLQITRHR